VPAEPAARRSGIAQVDRVALLPTEVRETSGLARIDGHFWTINDRGDDAVIYQLPSDGRRTDQQLYLAGARRYRLSTYAQWEAISWDGAERLVLSAERSPLSSTMLGEIRLDDAGEPFAPLSRAAESSPW
jgi:hypothetical protein